MKRLRRSWYWLLLGAAALATVCMDVYVAHRILDSNTSDFVHRGWLMVQNHDVLLRDYYRTTELSLLGQHWAYALFFLFIEDWTLVRILGTVLMQSLYVPSFLYMGRQAGIRKPVRVACAALLLAPFSTAYARLVLYHCYYILFMVESFLMAGLTLHTLRLWQQGRKALLPGLLLGVAWVLAGLNGVRQMMIVGAPLLLFGLIRLIQALNEHGWKKALLPIFQVEPSTLSPFTPDIRPDELTNLLNMWLMAIGVRVSEENLLSLRGAALAAALFSAVYGLIRSLRCREQATGRAMPDTLLMFVRWNEKDDFTAHFPQLTKVWESQTFTAYEMPKEMLTLP